VWIEVWEEEEPVVLESGASVFFQATVEKVMFQWGS
jgi:hypothetical protein